MSLTVVSTPIGNYGDITFRAVETLKACDILICEEKKPAEILLKRCGVTPKEMFFLNEHSTPKDLKELVELCRKKNVALISDCGTPGFCDPGADLVSACLKEKIKVDVNPGASSLMSLLALTGERVDEFYFAGFLPSENSARQKKINALSKISTSIIVMDTPYRLTKTLQELSDLFGAKQVVLGVDLTGPDHQVVRGKLKELATQTWPKAPFVLLIKH